MCSPGVIARLGLGSAVLLCAVNVTLLANAAWEARGLERTPAVRSLAAEIAPAASNSCPSDPLHVVGVAEQSGARSPPGDESSHRLRGMSYAPPQIDVDWPAQVPRRMSKEIRVSSWGELHDRLYEGSWHEPLGRFRSRFAFRGVFDVAADLTTSLCRLQGGQANVEGQILRAFRKYAQRDSVPGDSVWNWLALAQHHGLPRACSTGRFRRTWRCTSARMTPRRFTWTGPSGASITSAEHGTCRRPARPARRRMRRRLHHRDGGPRRGIVARVRRAGEGPAVRALPRAAEP